MEKNCPIAQTIGIGNTNIIPIAKTAGSEPIASDKPIVERFANHLLEDGKRPKTVESYAGDTEGFLLYLKQKDVQFEGEMKRYQKHTRTICWRTVTRCPTKGCSEHIAGEGDR